MTPMWQRTITFILLLAYAPMAGLASPNLVWCVGSDGHSAIENVKNNGKHQAALPIIETEPNAHIHQLAALDVHPDDCVDWTIFCKSVSARKQLAAPTLPDMSLAPLKSLALPPRLMDQVGPPRQSADQGRQAPRFPQLHHLKTVVLLT